MRRLVVSMSGIAFVLGALGSCAANPGGGAAARAEAVLGAGFGQFDFVARDGHRLRAYSYRGTGFDPVDGPVWFVMHGAGRDADRYLRAAAPVAERRNALAICIEFPRSHYPSGSDYTLGMTKEGIFGGESALDPADYVYANLETVFDLVRATLEGSQAGYYLFGHSAGAQFTHRLLTFLPGARVLGAVAANAGWYTLPADSDRDDHRMPYGLVGAPVEPADLAGFLRTDFTVLLGEADTLTADEDDLVRGTAEADAQGANRLERGQNYFRAGRELAARLDTDFAWRLETVPHVGHDGSRMIQSAGFLLFEPGAVACAPTAADAADGIVFTEILADPPAGSAGDLNRDGGRDPQEDEFVEIHNAGPDPVCLAGWTLGDAERPDRHVFPLGSVLGPGRTMVVFGGGVPTGDYAGAVVQWSSSGLSLSNRGDVIVLRDATGRVVRSFSWGDGDGDGRAPVEDHWPADLGGETSLQRDPAPGAKWSLRRGGASPGIASLPVDEEGAR